jgi:LPS sulfotransferase NodH
MEENNILIAEFMGAEVEIWKAHERLGDNTSEDAWYAYFDGNGVAVEELAYDTSWDWLMPVVEKIEQVHEGVPQELINLSLFSTIDEVYNAVVEFIKQQIKK